MPAINPERRKVFATAYIATGNGTQAAIQAGCPSASAAVTASRWLKNPEVLSLLKDEIGGHLRGLAPVAIKTLRILLEDPYTPPSTRLAVARDILDRVGFIPPKRPELVSEFTRREIEQLSIEELEKIASGGD